MKMERKNDYKNTYPPIQWPLLGCGKGSLRQTRDSKKLVLHGDSLQVRNILLIPALQNINEHM